jgi:competence protein ComEC
MSEIVLCCLAFLIGLSLGSLVISLNLIGCACILVFPLLLTIFIIKKNVLVLVSVCFCLGILRILIDIPISGPGDIVFYSRIMDVVEVTGCVSGDPVYWINGARLILDVNRIRIDGREMVVHGKIVLFTNPFDVFEYGSVLSVRGRLINKEINVFVYNPEIRVLQPAEGNVYSLIIGLRKFLMNMINTYIPQPASALVSGMLIGISDALPTDVQNVFRTLGLTHVLAVSGYNVALLIDLSFLLFARYRMSWRVFFSGAFLVFFIVLTGMSSSVLRAGLMGVFMLLAKFRGRHVNPIAALCFSGVVLSLFNPRIMNFDISFQLSFFATLGLIVFANKWNERFKTHPVFESFVVTSAAQVFTIPIILYNFGSFSLLCLVANFIVAPFIPLTMLLGFLCVAIGLFIPPIASVAGFICWVMVQVYLLPLGFLAKLPFALMQIVGVPVWIYAVYYFFIALMLFRKSGFWKNPFVDLWLLRGPV